MLRIFVNTWGNYNESGADGGRWIDFPMPESELDDILEDIAAKMGDDDPEWCIHDYEWYTSINLGEIDENDNIFDWNEKCLEAESLDEWELDEINAAIEALGIDFSEAMDRQQRGYFTFYHNQTLEDVAYEIVEECYFNRNTPDIFRSYFDYKAFARDLSFDGYYEVSNGVIRCD